MPPKSGDGEEMLRLSPEEQQVLKVWILGGAPCFPEVTPEDRIPEEIVTTPLAAKVKDIFINKCRGCHNPDEAGGGIRIINHDMLVKKRTVVIPGNPDASELFRLIAYEEDPVMPPREKDKNGKVKDKQLDPEEIAIIRQWIEDGAAEFPRTKTKE